MKEILFIKIHIEFNKRNINIDDTDFSFIYSFIYFF